MSIDTLSSGAQGKTVLTAHPVAPGLSFCPAVPVAKIARRARNPNSWEPQRFDRFAAAIDAGGFTSAILIRCTTDPAGNAEPAWEVVDGEHRLAAAVVAGMVTIPALVYDYGACSDELAAAKSLGHNVYRGSMSLTDVAHELELFGGLEGLEGVAGYSAADVASLLGALVAPVVDLTGMGAEPDPPPKTVSPSKLLGDGDPPRHTLKLSLDYATTEALEAAKAHLMSMDPDGKSPSVGLYHVLQSIS